MLGIGPFRAMILREQLEKSLQTHPEHTAQINELLSNRRLFHEWADTIARTNRSAVEADYTTFLQFIRNHWLDILMIGVKLVLLFAAENKTQGAR